MPTVPLPAALGPILEFLDLAGIAVFALSGALLAAVKKQTLVTFLFFAVVICLGAGLAVWLTPARLWHGRTLLWLDAIGLAGFATFGAAKALAFGIAPLPAFAMGVLTGCFGGIIRDVLADEPSILLRPELYVTAAGLSAALYVGLAQGGIEGGLAALIAALAGFAVRGLAILRGWALPAYRR